MFKVVSQTIGLTLQLKKISVKNFEFKWCYFSDLKKRNI